MHLVLFPRRRLAERYGPGLPPLAAALDAALAARAAAGLVSLAYDPAEGLLGLAPAALSPDALAGQLRAAADALAAQGGIIESLWIIGGPDELPFGSLPNPMPDSDGALLTDATYGLADAEAPLARWPVGRTPALGPAPDGGLAELLRGAAEAHRAGPAPPAEPLTLAAARWAEVTAAVLGRAGATAPALLSPPHGAGDAPRLEGARLIYCNLHGVRERADWLGQPADDSELIPALRPADLVGLRLRGALVLSQACYGARLAPVGAAESLAPVLLRAGAAALLAPLGLSYGAPDPPPGESDLLAARLLAALREPGARVGGALLAAQAGLLRELLRSGPLRAADLKTLLGFVLYGDPALAWTSR